MRVGLGVSFDDFYVTSEKAMFEEIRASRKFLAEPAIADKSIGRVLDGSISDSAALAATRVTIGEVSFQNLFPLNRLSKTQAKLGLRPQG
ncbi:hypothetical protein GCM10011358_24420 [Sinisalibacter lacisalsi]|uniref:Uncharacterized protein n=1 Tax=Sinisalibacter lacisalsi TaxID=1526570 RepID=A0ABQ1QPP0_9RHOB|nr:hypothetical protein GCM10011358_24420 [Sinisalibacter lacisalsi]